MQFPVRRKAERGFAPPAVKIVAATNPLNPNPMEADFIQQWKEFGTRGDAALVVEERSISGRGQTQDRLEPPLRTVPAAPTRGAVPAEPCSPSGLGATPSSEEKRTVMPAQPSLWEFDPLGLAGRTGSHPSHPSPR
jgi:hypothetical protein